MRNADKRALYKHFRIEIIEDVYRHKFEQLFDRCCFACYAPPPLELDHHIPARAGGRLVPGNIILLCPSCNNRKGSMPPSEFYSPAQNARAKRLFKQQVSLFEFTFDWAQWEADPLAYLLCVGVTPEAAQAFLAAQHCAETEDGITIVMK